VALVARSAGPLRDVVHGLRDTGRRAEGFPADVRDERQVRGAVDRVLSAFGRLDILVNNAGIAVWGPVQGFALADWERTLATNLTGPFLMARAVLPAMIQQGGGQILNLASGAGRGGLPNLAAYSASKAGLMAFCEALASEVREHRIKVMVLAPGSVATGFGEGFPAGRQGRSKRPLQPADVAAAAFAMVTQPPHAWLSEAVLRPLTLG
jgi:3-oxoacyl-[acyl-carrier protein] reductase